MRRNTKKKPSRRVICNDEAKKAILIALHEESGHRGRDGTARKILELYWWRDIYRDTKLHVQSCDECQKRFNVRVEEVLHPNLTSTMWDKVCVDVVHMPRLLDLSQDSSSAATAFTAQQHKKKLHFGKIEIDIKKFNNYAFWHPSDK